MTPDTVFDLASLTKPLATALVALALVERERVDLGSRIDEFVTGLPPGTGRITLVELLTHTSGLAPVSELHRSFPDSTRVDRTVARAQLLRMVPERRPGQDVVYSCAGYQIPGEALASLGRAPLDRLFDELVAHPLGLAKTRFTPPAGWASRCAATEYCRWRRRWVRGEVHDESAFALEGIAGNAGLFSTADEVLVLAGVYGRGGEAATPEGERVRLVSSGMAARALTDHTPGTAYRRGLGVELNSPAAAGGPAFAPDSWGHTGFTGTSFWTDPATRLTVVALTNRLQYGREVTADAIVRFRRELHAAFAEAIA